MPREAGRGAPRGARAGPLGAGALAGRLALALDPVRLAIRAGITPDPWQSDVLRTDVAQLALLCSRQAGKSTVSALLAVHEALFRAPALVLLLAPALRQSQELFRKIRDVLAALDHVAGSVTSESALSLEFASGSRIVCLPGNEATVRGFSSVRLLIVDEASRVPDALYQAVRPMLAVSGGRIALLTTPFGRRGFFFEEWERGGPGWHRVRIPAHDVPRIAPAWLAHERARIGDWWFRQEYLCEFVDTNDQVFAYDTVMAAIRDDVAPLFPHAA